MTVSAAMILWALLTCLTAVTAQTYTTCNPLQQSLTSKTLTTDFTKGASSNWNVINASTISYNTNGVDFTINSKTDTPTLGTNFYLLFGHVEVRMKVSPGTGIVSAIVLQSDDLDEIDWEMLGGSPSSVQSNFFGKGNTSTYNRAQTHAVSASTSTWHTYGIDWTSSAITWTIDGVAVRTLSSTDATTLNGKNFPQSPCQLRIGNWPAGASSSAGTVEWAGGATDFSKAPFTMSVSNISITNYNPASSYTYGDNSGSWQSIQISGAGSNVKSGASNSTSTTSAGNTSSSLTVGTSTRVSASSSSSSSSDVTTTTASAAPSASSSVHSANAAGQLESRICDHKITYGLALAVLGISWL